MIELKDLKKTYGKVKALDGLTMSVRNGEIMGLVGPNGAGKTTAIRILLGLLRKDSGTAKVFEEDAWKEASQIHSRLAYVPGDVNFWDNLTGGEVIDLLGRLRGNLDEARRGKLIRRFSFDPTKKCRTYSKGNRQKLSLIAAFASDVELYILDEPSSGLDPLMYAVFKECVKEAKEAGKTVLLSSHILAEVEELCDRVSVIREGIIVESGSVEEMRHLSRLVVRVDLKESPTGIDKMKALHNLEEDGKTIRFQVDDEALQDVLRQLLDYGIVNLVSHPPTLEELFMRHYGDENND